MSSQKPSWWALTKQRPIDASSMSSTFPVVVRRVLIGWHAKTIRVSRPSIYEFAGGDQAFLALATAFHERCLEDPDLNHVFSHHASPDHVENLAAYWAEVLEVRRRTHASMAANPRCSRSTLVRAESPRTQLCRLLRPATRRRAAARRS